MNDLEPYIRLGVALAIGLLIGLERGWSQREKAEGERIAGIRTFGLIGLLGGIASHLDGIYSGPVLAVAFGALSLIVGATLIVSRRAMTDRGITTSVAAIITFALGTMAAYGELALAGACAVVMTIILGLKPTLHRWLEHLEQAELFAALKLLLMSVVLLPVLPDRAMGPWDALNPYTLWLMVILISSLNFASHIAVRWAGAKRGIMLTGLIGGLSSSTAVAVSLSRLANDHPSFRPIAAPAILAAATLMFPRILFIGALFAPDLATNLAAPMLLMTAATIGVMAAVWPRGEKSLESAAPAPDIEPFDLSIPIKFGLFLALIMMVAAGLRTWIGETGLVVASAFAGLSDVDAITLTVAESFSEGISLKVACGSIFLAAAVNTLVKAAIVGWFGPAEVAIRVFAGLSAAILAGLAGYWLFLSGYLMF